MRSLKNLLLASAVPAVLLFATPVQAGDEHLVLKKIIDVGPGKTISAFDISFVDSRHKLYVLADRTNASVDFFDSEDAVFVDRVGGFTGAVVDEKGAAVNSKSGPDGVLVIKGKEVWAGDGDSTLKVINVASRKIVDSINTGGKLRVDEMAYDSDDHIIAVANNADTPPFVTLVNTDNHQILGKITFDGKNGTPDATDTGIEQPQWSPKTGLFYVSVPQIVPGTDDASAAKGGISVIDPHALKVLKTYEVDNCSPAGLAIGPDHEALIGCGGAFNKKTKSVIINIVSGKTFDIPDVGGSDEVWYEPKTKHYFLGSRNNLDASGKPNPVVGTIDAKKHTYDGDVATSTTAHSVAADSRSHNVFVPIGKAAAGTDPTNPCPTTGCIAVFQLSSQEQ